MEPIMQEQLGAVQNLSGRSLQQPRTEEDTTSYPQQGHSTQPLHLPPSITQTPLRDLRMQSPQMSSAYRTKEYQSRTDLY